MHGTRTYMWSGEQHQRSENGCNKLPCQSSIAFAASSLAPHGKTCYAQAPSLFHGVGRTFGSLIRSSPAVAVDLQNLIIRSESGLLAASHVQSRNSGLALPKKAFATIRDPQSGPSCRALRPPRPWAGGPRGRSGRKACHSTCFEKTHLSRRASAASGIMAMRSAST